jgi:hypothetical protein
MAEGTHQWRRKRSTLNGLLRLRLVAWSDWRIGHEIFKPQRRRNLNTRESRIRSCKRTKPKHKPHPAGRQSTPVNNPKKWVDFDGGSTVVPVALSTRECQ